MANTYVKAAFCIIMSRNDADIVRDAEKACDIIDECKTEDALAAQYQAMGPAFKNAFPALENNVFGSFFKLFDDPVYPSLDCDIDYGHPNADGQCELMFSGEQFGVDQVAALLFAACKSALPCGFEYSYDCDRLRLDQFGGGAVVITERGITYQMTSEFLRQAAAASPCDCGDGPTGLILAARDSANGLTFWNDTDGYGDLAGARIFTATEADAFHVRSTGHEANWLTMPAPRPTD